MRRPRLLDLFCGEGGASMGYHLAGFDVEGVDEVAQPDYPFEFHQADAMTCALDGFDAYAASPPCTGHSTMASVGGFRGGHGTEWMLHATIERLAATGKPYVVENVAGADLRGALSLCGTMFALTDGPYTLARHRQFVSNVFMMAPGRCYCRRRGVRVIGVYGDLSRNDRKATSRTRADGRPHGDMRAGVERARRIMRMPWASAKGLTQAVPPAYTRFIGEQLIEHLSRVPVEVTE